MQLVGSDYTLSASMDPTCLPGLAGRGEGGQGVSEVWFHPSSHASKAGGEKKKALSQLPFLSSLSEPERMGEAIEQAKEFPESSSSGCGTLGPPSIELLVLFFPSVYLRGLLPSPSPLDPFLWAFLPRCLAPWYILCAEPARIVWLEVSCLSGPHSF